MSPARDYALASLCARALPNWAVEDFRDVPPPRDGRDLALAEQLTTGTIKNLLLLQHLIEHYSGRPLRKIDGVAQRILAIGLYQLRFLSRIPASAAVDQAVEQAKRFSKGRSSAFVNAILRRATREPEVALPDAQADPAEYARLVLSHPPELFASLTELLGLVDAIRFCEHNNRRPTTIVRLIPPTTLAQLAEPDVTITPHEAEDRAAEAARPVECGAVNLAVVEPAKHELLARWSAKGMAQAQDPTAANVINFCDIHPGQRVLDRCCGFGTKTLQLRERLGPAGEVVAIDPDGFRLQQLRHVAEQRGVVIRTLQATMLKAVPEFAEVLFDRILVDVPCSNSGVLARRPEARYTQTPAALRSLGKLQRQIMDDTAPHAALGGLLIYSTCSVWPQENGLFIRSFLERHADFQLVEEHSTLPSFADNPTSYHDGGYVAVLKRAG